MSIKENPYICDKCGRDKGCGNRWLIGIIIGQGGTRIVSIDPLDDYSGYAIIAWEEGIAFRNKGIVHHLCSEACALAMQGKYLRKDTSLNNSSGGTSVG